MRRRGADGRFVRAVRTPSDAATFLAATPNVSPNTRRPHRRTQWAYYAVADRGPGLNPAVYTSWRSCQAAIAGIDGAIYAGYTTRNGAEAFCRMQDNPEHRQYYVIYAGPHAGVYDS